MNKITELAKTLSKEDPVFAKCWESSHLLTELIQARIKAGLSQTDVARFTGLSQPAVARIESFDLNIRLDTLLKYAWAVGATVMIKSGPTRRRRHANIGSKKLSA